MAVTWPTKGPSYRDARDRLTDRCSAQVLNHEDIRQALVEVGDSCEYDQQNKIAAQEVKALFIEVDGFCSRFQKNKKCKGHNQQCEVKMAIIHEGWAARHRGKKSDYKLVNPTYVSDLKADEDFWEQVRGIICTKYRNIDSIPVIINGDGAEWIREGTAYCGLYTAREIRTVLRQNKEALRKVRKALRKDDMGTLLCVVTEAWASMVLGGARSDFDDFGTSF
jgi:hypothetical protein